MEMVLAFGANGAVHHTSALNSLGCALLVHEADLESFPAAVASIGGQSGKSKRG